MFSLTIQPASVKIRNYSIIKNTGWFSKFQSFVLFFINRTACTKHLVLSPIQEKACNRAYDLPHEGVCLVVLRHEKVHVVARQRHLQVGLDQPQVCRVPLQPVDADDEVGAPEVALAGPPASTAPVLHHPAQLGLLQVEVGRQQVGAQGHVTVQQSCNGQPALEVLFGLKTGCIPIIIAHPLSFAKYQLIFQNRTICV